MNGYNMCTHAWFSHPLSQLRGCKNTLNVNIIILHISVAVTINIKYTIVITYHLQIYDLWYMVYIFLLFSSIVLSLNYSLNILMCFHNDIEHSSHGNILMYLHTCID